MPCQRLQHLQALELAALRPAEEGTLDDCLQAVLQQAPGLTQLQWTPWVAAQGRPLPACLETYGGLRRLSLKRQELLDLPHCAFLPGKPRSGLPDSVRCWGRCA